MTILEVLFSSPLFAHFCDFHFLDNRHLDDLFNFFSYHSGLLPNHAHVFELHAFLYHGYLNLLLRDTACK